MRLALISLSLLIAVCVLAVCLAHKEDPRPESNTASPLPAVDSRAVASDRRDEPPLLSVASLETRETSPKPVEPVLAQAQPQPSESDEWSARYQHDSIADLMARRNSLRSDLFMLVQPEADKLTAAGRAEYLGQASTYSPPPEDYRYIRSVYVPGAGSTDEVRRVTLPEDEYPELYKLKREIEWLEREAQLRQQRANR